MANNTAPTYFLTSEEIGFAIGAGGDLSLAAGYLNSAYGQLDPKELAGRLAAASHSLMTRGLYRLNADASEGEIDPALADCLLAFSKSARSIRCVESRADSSEDRIVSMLLSNDNKSAVEYEAVMGVAARLTHHHTIDAYVERMLHFVAPIGEHATAKSAGRIPGDALRKARQFANDGEDGRAELCALLDKSLPHKIAETIATDLIACTRWGNMMHLVNDSTNESATSNRGMFYAMSDASGWAFSYDSANADEADVWPADSATMRTLCRNIASA
jgi:hypothetical protein